MPLNTSTLRPLHIAAMPPTSPATILFLRSWVTAKLTVGCAGLDAELGGVRDVAVHGRGLEERLGRDAATVEAGPAEGVALDHRDLDARRRGVQRGGVATGSSADDDEIELLGRRDHLFSVVGAHSERAHVRPVHRSATAGRRRRLGPRSRWRSAAQLPSGLLVAAAVQQHAAASPRPRRGRTSARTGARRRSSRRTRRRRRRVGRRGRRRGPRGGTRRRRRDRRRRRSSTTTVARVAVLGDARRR